MPSLSHSSKLLADRRATISREIAAHVSGAVTPQAACMLAAEGLSAFRDDVPFALFYLVDPGLGHAILAGMTGMEPGGPESPFVISLERGRDDAPWPVAEVLRSGVAQVAHEALVLPIRSREAPQVFGCAVFGLGFAEADDEAHRRFLELLAENVGTAIRHVQSDSNPADPLTRNAASAPARPVPQSQQESRTVVLLVEDNRADVFLVERAIEYHQLSVRIVVAQDGEEAVQYLERAASDPNVACPGVMLVDLNLPKRSGIEVLERVRNSPHCSRIPVIIVTSSDSRNDREKTAELGATRYFRKPSSYQEFLEIGQVLRQVIEEAGQSR